eukprot:493090-Amorphochlora_amoeboformis.AAC.1
MSSRATSRIDKPSWHLGWVETALRNHLPFLRLRLSKSVRRAVRRIVAKGGEAEGGEGLAKLVLGE